MEDESLLTESKTEEESLFQVGESVEFWRVLVHLSLLAFCLVLFEKSLHRLEKKFPPSDKYQHMLKKVYGELMVLGLISLGVKILEEIPSFDSESKAMVAFEVADLAIFLLALALILQSTAIFLLLRNQNLRADQAELITTKDMVRALDKSTDSDTTERSFLQTMICFCKASKKKKAIDMELIELRLLRRLFLRRFGFPQLFPFSKYLLRAQANQISRMIEVEPSMWLVLLAVAWGICGLLHLLEQLDAKIPERQELVEAIFMTAWILLLIQLIVSLYLRSCVHYLLRAAAFSDDKRTLATNLGAIVEEEAKAWRSEDDHKALEIMSGIQEQHEEFEYKRERLRKKQKSSFQFVVGFFGENAQERPTGVVAGSPSIDIRLFSHKGWHVGVMLLLILNGFLMTLFVQCVVYDLSEIYEDYGSMPAVLVPLPLALNMVVLQRHIFYDFVVVSSILRIDSHTLSDVVENFGEVVRLRSEFTGALLQHLTQHELSVTDLKAELKSRDAIGSGFITVEELRTVLSKFGFCLTRFRFNSVVKMLFQVEGTSIPYSQVVHLVGMAQNKSLARNTQQPHPLLRPSVLVYDSVEHRTTLAQSNYGLFASTRQLPMRTNCSMVSDVCSTDTII